MPGLLSSPAFRYPGLALPLAAITAVGALSLAVPRLARAQTDPDAAVEQVTSLNRRAVDEYQNLNFDEARKLLTDALQICTQSGIENHPVSARTYIHLGVVSFVGFKQRDLAIRQFRKALDIQPDIKVDRLLATPEIQEVFNQAVATKGESGGATGAAEAGKGQPPARGQPPAKAPAASRVIEHEPVTSARRGKPITITASIDPSLHPAKVVLAYKSDGAEQFSERAMKEDTPGNWSGEIPASATGAAGVRYYLEAMGADDVAVASKGSEADSMRIVITGGEGAESGSGNGRAPAEGTGETGEGPKWFFGLAVGSGIGWTTGKGEVNNADEVQPTGFSPSKLLHISPELGYFIQRSLLLSLQLRLQIVTGPTSYYSDNKSDCGGDGVCSPASYAFAGFARASWFFAERGLRPFATGILGLGQIRHVAEFKSEKNCGQSHTVTCVDTVAAGPVFVGAGGGLLYELTPAFGLTAGLNALLGFTTFTFHVDLNLGATFSY